MYLYFFLKLTVRIGLKRKKIIYNIKYIAVKMAYNICYMSFFNFYIITNIKNGEQIQRMNTEAC